MSIIKATNLTKIYHNNYNYIRAVSNCNLEIDKGEFVVITGTKGSGKSTLLQMLGGFNRPSGGKVHLNQKDLYSLSEADLAFIYREEIGFIFQDYQLIQGLTVYENIIMPTLLKQEKYDKSNMIKIVDGLHIKELLQLYPKKLSGDQLQCVAIARALMNNPKIIFADEPMNHVQYHKRKDVLDYLLNYVHRHHRTLVMVTHNPDLTIFADHIIKLNQGVIMEDKKFR